MEKLKVKHDHSLTDILKVLIFAIVLLIPGFMFLPSMLYFGMNEQANAPTKQVDIIENIEVNFNQLSKNSYSTYVSNYYVSLKKTETGNNTQWFGLQNNVPFEQNHYYYLRLREVENVYQSDYVILPGSVLIYPYTSPNGAVVQITNISNNYIGYVFGTSTPTNTIFKAYLNLIDLTFMFGSGKEPTQSQMDQWYEENYYEYTTYTKEYLYDVTTETETVVDITTQLEYNWEQIWQKPLLSWTNRSILKNGLDNFVNVFGIDNNSYITNLLTYELIMVGVYIVIDIVLALFKWLTHMIGNK